MGRGFRRYLRSCTIFLDCKTCLADSGLWTRTDINAVGTEFYECVLLRAGNALVTSENTEKALRKETRKYYKLNPGSVELQSACLGGRSRKVLLDNESHAWDFISSLHD